MATGRQVFRQSASHQGEEEYRAQQGGDHHREQIDSVPSQDADFPSGDFSDVAGCFPDVFHGFVLFDNERLSVWASVFFVFLSRLLRSFPAFGFFPEREGYFSDLRSSSTVMPGRSPSTGAVGRARTSKVLMSYCPLVLVAFQVAYEPRSFR